MFKRKKKINWKLFAKMYRELGEYRLIKVRGKTQVQARNSKYNNGQWYDTGFSDNSWLGHGYTTKYEYGFRVRTKIEPPTDDELIQKILDARYEKIKEQRDSQHRKRKVIYKHP